jgi:SH3 domain protein
MKAQATRYVSDEFQAPVREAPSEDSRILTLLLSGTPVEVLEEGVQGYSLVQAQGIEGWILMRHLMEIPSGRARLAAAERRFEERRIALKQCRREVKDQWTRVDGLEQRNQVLEDQNRELKRDFDSLRKRTAKPLATEAENVRLQQALRRERKTARTLMDENDALKAQAIRDWFLIGAGVALGSLLLGVIIARIPWRRQRSW